MKLPIAGPAYELESQDINIQRCINLFPLVDGPEGQGIVLTHTPGLKELVDATGSEVRGLININDVVYAVVDAKVYKLDINEDAETATVTEIGEIASSTGKVSMARNPTQVMIVDGTEKGYVLTVATDAFVEITDPDFTGGDLVVFMDSYFIYNTPGNDATMYATAINDGSSVDALDVTVAEAHPDRLVGIAVDKRELWAFGERSVEVWYNAANATGFPFSRRDVAINQGCGAKNSILNFDNTLVWLDDRGYVVTSAGYNLQVISSEAIGSAIRGYKIIADAQAFQYTSRGHLFYVITFPSEKRTWAYDSVTKQWHEMAYFTQDDEFEHHIANCHERFKQWDLVGDRKSGKVYIMKSDHYTDGADPIHRLRVTGHQRQEFTYFGVDELELLMDAGRGTVSGAGSDPQVSMRYSNDGGHSWSDEMSRSIGKIGQYGKRIIWNRLGSAREWTFEFRVADPVPVTFIEASARVSGGFHA